MSEREMVSMSAGGGSVSGFSIERLRGRENYLLWKFNMRNLLIHDDLWCSIDGYLEDDKSSPELKRRMDERALAKICLSVDASCVSHVMTAKTSKDAWLSLEKAYDDKGIGRRLKLLRMLCSVKLDDLGGDMDKYVSECLSLSQQLAAVNKPIDDEFLAAIILQGLPSRFDPMIMALESSVSNLTSDFVKAKLLQDTKWSDNCKGGDCLIADKSANKSGKRRQDKKPRCWNCGKSGHVKKECTQKAAAMVASRFLADTWYVDSGASSHMTGQRDWLHDFTTKSVEVNVASGQTLKCVGIGNVCLKLSNYDLTLKEVMYVPGLSVNLLSVNCLTVKGFRVEFIESTCKIFKNKSCIASVRSVGGVYKLHTNAVALSSVNKEVSKESWHHRLGHLSYDSLKSLSHVIDFQKTEIANNCDICILGKQIRFPFKKSGRDVAAKCLDLVHTDLCSIPVASHSGIITTSHIWGYLADTRGRRKILIISMTIGYVAGTAAAFSPNWIVLSLLKLLSSASMSGSMALSMTLLSECTPAAKRSTLVLLTTSANLASAGVMAVLAIPVLPLTFSYYIPFLDIYFNSWRVLDLIFAVPCAISAIGCYFANESPKYLVSVGREEDALAVLKTMYVMNTGKSADSYKVDALELDEDQSSSFNKGFWGSIASQIVPIVKPPLLKNTLLLSFLFGICYITMNAFFVWLPYIVNAFMVSVVGGQRHLTICQMIRLSANSTSVQEIQDCSMNTQAMTLVFGISMVLAVGNILMSSIINCIGRKALFIGIQFIPGVAALVINTSPYWILSAVIFMVFLSAIFNLGFLSSYSVDVFPTYVRAMAVCLTLMVGRGSAVIGINVLKRLLDENCEAAFYIFGSVTFGGGLVGFLLPSDAKIREQKKKLNT